MIDSCVGRFLAVLTARAVAREFVLSQHWDSCHFKGEETIHVASFPGPRHFWFT